MGTGGIILLTTVLFSYLHNDLWTEELPVKSELDAITQLIYHGN